MEPSTIIICAIIVLVAVVITWFAAIAYRKNIAEAKLGKAEDKAREIIDEALKDVENKKRDILLTAKEEAMKTQADLEKEVKERRNEIQRMEKRVLSREENLDKKSDTLERREQSLSAREANLSRKQAEVDELSAKRQQELERISGLTSEQAKEYLLRTVEDEVKHETLCKYKPGKTEPMQSAFIGFVLFAYNIQYLFFKILDFIVFMRQCFDMTITSKDLLSDS